MVAIAAGGRLVVVDPVLCREFHAGLGCHGVGQVSRQVSEVEGVVSRRAFQGDLVLHSAPLFLPVLQLHTQDGRPLTGKGLDLPEA